MSIVIIGNRDIAKFRGWLMRDLVAAGHRVFACAPGGPRLAADVTQIGAQFVPMSMARTGLNPFRDLVDILHLRRSLRLLNADIVLCHSTKANVIGALAASIAGVPRIFVMVEGFGYAFTGGTELRRRLLRAILLTTFRVVFRLCTTVFVLNESDLTFVRASRLVSRKQHAIKLNGTGVDLREFSFSPASEPQNPRFLLIARLLREKGILEYVEAARIIRARNPHCRFQLLGPLDSNPGALRRDQVVVWESEGVIEYLGEASDVRPYLRSCEVYVLPSYREGMPRTILEALAIGRAIVTTNVPGCCETVVDGHNGYLVPARDPSALAHALQRFIDDPRLVQTMGKASRALAEERFDVRQVNAVMMQAMAI